MLAFGQPASAQFAIEPLGTSVGPDRIAVVTGQSSQEILCGLDVDIVGAVLIDIDTHAISIPILGSLAFLFLEDAPKPGTRFDVIGPGGACNDESGALRTIYELEEIGPGNPLD